MGTLFNQLPRNYKHVGDINGWLTYYAELAKQHKCSLADVIALKSALEQERANHLRVEDGDIKDEQLAGFGELLRELIEVLHTIAGDPSWNIRNPAPSTGFFASVERPKTCGQCSYFSGTICKAFLPPEDDLLSVHEVTMHTPACDHFDREGGAK